MFTKSLTAALFAIPFVAYSVSAGACTRKYTIKEGDFCDSISAAKNVSTYQLATVNYGHIDAACSNLQIGDTICLGYEKEDCSTTYVVQPNDTCDQISAKAGVNNTILYLNNPQINDDCTNIYIGEVLCTSNTVQCPPAPAGVGKSGLPAATIPPNAVPAHPSPTPAPSSTNTPAPAPQTGSHDSDDDDDDDEDLPFCDEL